jgi:hypothetical protein
MKFMIRQIIIPTQKNLTIELPDDFVGKSVEITLELENVQSFRPQKSIEQLKKELEGLTVDMKGYKFDREEANDYE